MSVLCRSATLRGAGIERSRNRCPMHGESYNCAPTVAGLLTAGSCTSFWSNLLSAFPGNDGVLPSVDA